MSGPSPQALLTSGDSAQNALEEKQKENSGDDPINSDPTGSGSRPPLLSSIRKDEAVVTRRELWSYYRQSSFFFPFLNSLPQFETSFKSVLQWK